MPSNPLAPVSCGAQGHRQAVCRRRRGRARATAHGCRGPERPRTAPRRSALRSQGLIRTRTGPGGGIFLAERDFRSVLAEHMEAAQAYLVEMVASITGSFLRADGG